MGIAEFGANIGASAEGGICCAMLTIHALLVPTSIVFQWVVYIDHEKIFEYFGSPT